MVYWKNSKPLDIENEIKITLVIRCKYKKWEDIQLNLETEYLLKAMDIYLLLKIWVKILVKIKSKSLSGKYSQKPLDRTKQPATDGLKTSNKVIHIKAERTGHLIINKIDKKGTKISKNLGTVTNENDKEKTQEVIDDLRIK